MGVSKGTEKKLKIMEQQPRRNFGRNRLLLKYQIDLLK